MVLLIVTGVLWAFELPVIAYGQESGSGTIRDVEGNAYRTIQIGTQRWTAENLNVSHYANGDPLPEVQDPNEWVSLTTGAWCYYDNDPRNGQKYGY